MANLTVYDKDPQWNELKPMYLEDRVDVEIATLITGLKIEGHEVKIEECEIPIMNFMAAGKPPYAQVRFSYAEIEIVIKKLQNILDTQGRWVKKKGGK